MKEALGDIVRQMEYEDGTKLWYRNQLLHRTDGPALKNSEGSYYFLNGVNYTKEEFDQKISSQNHESL